MDKNSFDLIPVFMDAVRKTDATVEEIEPAPEILCKSLMKAVRGCQNIIMSEPEFISQSMVKNFQDNINLITNPTANQLAHADAGITDAFAGVAQTGSVCISVSPNNNTYVSLLPRKHIVILESKRIVKRPGEIFNEYFPEGLGERTGLIFISGPSATADMGELVKGVHGPDKLHIILLTEK